MEMPDTIYAIKGVTSRFDGVWDDYQWADQRGHKYHHDRVYQEVVRHRNELQAKLDASNEIIRRQHEAGISQGAKLQKAQEFIRHMHEFGYDKKRARTTLEEIM